VGEQCDCNPLLLSAKLLNTLMVYLYETRIFRFRIEEPKTLHFLVDSKNLTFQRNSSFSLQLSYLHFLGSKITTKAVCRGWTLFPA
jgi:hypothetical protein